MPSTINADNGAISGSAGVKTTADSSGVLELQANGTTNFTLGASSVVINESGADVDTRIEGDTDANLFFADASTDRIGIGTNAPDAPLHIAKSSATSGVVINAQNSTTGSLIQLACPGVANLRFGAPNADAFVWQTFGSGSYPEQMRLTSTGLGIGTSSPGYKLDVNNTNGSAATARLNGNDQSNVRLRLENGGSGGRTWEIVGGLPGANNANFSIRDVTGSTTPLTLDASGNLGVGTTSPAGADGKAIVVYNGSGAARLALKNNSTGDASGDGFQLAVSGTTAYIEQRENDALVITTNNTERARISSGGSLLVGTNSDFAFSGTTFINSSTTNCIFANTTAGAGTGYLLFQGRSGAANVNTAGTTVFSVTDNGNVTNTNNSYGAISDEKLKQDIVDATSQWDDIKGLRVRKFRYKAAPAAPLQIGLIAQEAETVSPGLVEEIFDQEEVEVVDESGNVKKEARIAETSTKSVKYSVLYMKAVKALQEAMARIESLEAEVAALKAR